MPLTSPHASALEIEGSILALWEEFLRGYFDNAMHALGPYQTVKFPTAQLRFQQSQITQPLDGRSITLTMASPASVKRAWDMELVDAVRRTEETLWHDITFSFWVRASGQFAGPPVDASDKAAYECQFTADRLFALLSNAYATKPLSEKGIMHLRPRPPQLVASGVGSAGGDAAKEYYMRVVSCRASVRCPVLSQLSPTAAEIEQDLENN
jgi:hypothetical protein